MATITADLSAGSYAVDIRNGTHTWRADEPESLGGTDTGPNPYELLLGSVAACTSITLSMYAQRKGIALDSVSVTYTYEKIHVDDCATCDESADGYIDQVTSEIFVEGDFDDQTRQRLEQIAQRCPVHRTLESGIHFDEKVVVG